MIWMQKVNAWEGKQLLFTLSLSDKATKKGPARRPALFISDVS